MNGYCILSNAFSASNDMIIFFSFEFVYIVDYFDGFSYIEPSLHPWDEAFLIMMDDCFDVFLDSVCENFTEVFLFFFFLVFGFWFLVFGDRVSLYSPGCPRIQKSACLCLPSAGIKGMHHHCLATLRFLFVFFELIYFFNASN